MTSIENLYYAIGELAYAIARVDGKIQKEEREKFNEIMNSELENNEHNFDISGIVFQLMSKEKVSSQTSYDWAMKQIKMNSHYLSPQLKDKMVSIMEKVAEAYPPVTKQEKDMINKCRETIEELHGDPVFFE